MSTPTWQPGFVYAPGAVVQRASSPSAIPDPPTNGDFEAGASGWTLGTGFTIQNVGHPYIGTWSLKYNYAAADNYAVNVNSSAVVPGQRITASCQVRGESSHSSRSRGRVVIAWYDQYGVLISYSGGNWVGVISVYGTSAVTSAIAPALAATAKIGCQGHVESGYGVTFDNFVWDALEAPVVTGLVFKAVQAVAGHSGTNEPAWPIVAGGQVVDNEVTWEAEYITRITWEASPLLTSGNYEPAWPEAAGATVADNDITWEAISGRITDSKCPQSAIVAIAASKIFAADGDIIAFSATVNPLDWSTAQDAGYLPFGLQTHGSTAIAAMGLYRGNLIAFNSEGYQMWQVDEDPANMALLDASPIGCTYPRSIQPVSNDLVFLSQQGIRNIGIAGASTNLEAGSFGKPVDKPIQDLIQTIAGSGIVPHALYWPSSGQYWLIFDYEVYVLTMNGGPADASWSRYEFPFNVDEWAILDGELYLRCGPRVIRMDSTETIFNDDVGGGPGVVSGAITWPYLDFGRLGVEKQLEGFDLVCDGAVSVSIGYDQSDDSVATTPYALTEGDTLTGNLIPIPLTAPSFQLRLTFSADTSYPWEWEAATLYLTDQRRVP